MVAAAKHQGTKDVEGTSSEKLKLIDQRTMKEYEVPIENDTVSGMALRQIKVNDDDFGMMSYDPAYKNTASTKSTITFIDGERGILEYRGYPIAELAKESTFLEVAYLIIFGELPNQQQLDEWVFDVTHHTFLHENLKSLMEAFRHDAHPMGMFVSSVAALSTFYPGSRNIADPSVRLYQMKRMIAKVPTIAAYSYRHSKGLPYVSPDNDLTYTGNFLSMMYKMSEVKYEQNPIL